MHFFAFIKTVLKTPPRVETAPPRKEPMVTITLPEWAAALRSRLNDADEETRLNAVAEVVGLPLITAYPRPRQAAAWEVREWRKFAAENGFKEMSQSHHAFQFAHVDFPTLRWGCSTTPSDICSAMASATQLRNNARTFYGRLLTIMLSMMAKPDAFPWKPDLYAIDIGTFGSFVRRASEVPDLVSLAMGIARENRDDSEIGDPKEFRRSLLQLQKEFNLHPRHALTRCGVGEETAERLVSVLALNDDSQLRVFRDVVANLKDLLEGMREQEVQKEIQKRQAREARAVEVVEEAKAAPKPSEEYATMIANLQREVGNDLIGFRNAVGRVEFELTQKLKTRLEQLPLLPPDIDEIPVIKASMEALQIELHAAKEKIAAYDAVAKERDELKQLLEASDATDPWLARFKEFVGFLKAKKLDEDHGPRALTKILDEVLARVAVEDKAIGDAELIRAAKAIPTF